MKPVRYVLILISMMFSMIAVAQNSGANPATNMNAMFDQHRHELGICAGPAASLCKKKTRDMAINADEFKCLYDKVFRQTRNALPVLDNTDCSKKIKEISANFEAHAARYTKSIKLIYEGGKAKVDAACKEKAKEQCQSDQMDHVTFKCLWDKSTRLTRNAIPGYDNSDCDKEIKKLASQNSFGRPAGGGGGSTPPSPTTPSTR